MKTFVKSNKMISCLQGLEINFCSEKKINSHCFQKNRKQILYMIYHLIEKKMSGKIFNIWF